MLKVISFRICIVYWVPQYSALRISRNTSFDGPDIDYSLEALTIVHIGEAKGRLWNGWTHSRPVVRCAGDRRASRFTFYVASDRCLRRFFNFVLAFHISAIFFYYCKTVLYFGIVFVYRRILIDVENLITFLYKFWLNHMRNWMRTSSFHTFATVNVGSILNVRCSRVANCNNEARLYCTNV